MSGNLSRRSFLKLTAATLGGGALACGGLGFLATRQPGFEAAQPFTCGDNPKAKTLVTYATKCGSTAEIAQTIAATLCENGASVDVMPVKEVTSLEGYTAVVIGSAIRIGKWLPEASGFVETHKAELSRIPTAYFLASLFLVDASAERLAEVKTYLDPVRQVLEPASMAYFTGKLDTARLSWLEQQMTKSLKSPIGDFRDWNAIRGWAKELCSLGFAVPVA